MRQKRWHSTLYDVKQNGKMVTIYTEGGWKFEEAKVITWDDWCTVVECDDNLAGKLIHVHGSRKRHTIATESIVAISELVEPEQPEGCLRADYL